MNAPNYFPNEKPKKLSTLAKVLIGLSAVVLVFVALFILFPPTVSTKSLSGPVGIVPRKLPMPDGSTVDLADPVIRAQLVALKLEAFEQYVDPDGHTVWSYHQHALAAAKQNGTFYYEHKPMSAWTYGLEKFELFYTFEYGETAGTRTSYQSRWAADANARTAEPLNDGCGVLKTLASRSQPKPEDAP